MGRENLAAADAGEAEQAQQALFVERLAFGRQLRLDDLAVVGEPALGNQLIDGEAQRDPGA